MMNSIGSPGLLGILFITCALLVAAFILYSFVVGVRAAQKDVQELDEEQASAPHPAVVDVQVVTDHGVEHRREATGES